MRTVLVCLLLSGCSALDGIADGNTYSLNRVYLGSESITVSMHDDLDRYTCGAQSMICDAAGSKWSCSCGNFSFR